MRPLYSITAYFITTAIPLFAVASSHWTIESIVDKIVSEVLNPLIALLMILATVVFLWGVIQMLMNPDNEQKRTEGKKHMIWGIIGLTIMVSVWGIVGVLCNFFETCDIIMEGGEDRNGGDRNGEDRRGGDRGGGDRNGGDGPLPDRPF